MIKITIVCKKQYICTADGKRMVVFPAKAKIGTENRLLQECRGVKDSELAITLRRWIFSRKLELTHDLVEGITEYLREYSTRKDYFDCYAFANLVCNVRPHRATDMLWYWSITPIVGEPTVGSVVFLLTERVQRFHHAALYIGYGIYVSVYGAYGDLEFSTLEDMRRDFGAEDVVIATPRVRRPTIF